MIKLVYSILGQAATEGASDIHFEPGEDEMRVRFRVDGVLYEAARVPKRMVAGVVSRVKIMSDLDIAEKRVPQDGRVSVNVEDRKVDLRVTTLPTQRGEGATIRILDKEQALRTLDELGHGRRPAASASRRPSARPYGAVLVTGPTGSGKSTTLYAALDELNAVEKNIITIEDPVEYRIDGHQPDQRQPQGGARPSPPACARSCAPTPTSSWSARSATPRPRGSRSRRRSPATWCSRPCTPTTPRARSPGCTKMGIESFLTASAVDCVVAQRLARKLCTHCKRRTLIPQAALLEAGLPGRRRPRGLRAGRLRALQPDAATGAGSGSSR